jgi:hypothetical protein
MKGHWTILKFEGRRHPVFKNWCLGCSGDFDVGVARMLDD